MKEGDKNTNRLTLKPRDKISEKQIPQTGEYSAAGERERERNKNKQTDEKQTNRSRRNKQKRERNRQKIDRQSHIFSYVQLNKVFKSLIIQICNTE